MVDTLCYQLQRRLSEALGVNEDSDSGLNEVSLKEIEQVLAKAEINLEKAAEDQDTSDATLVNMEKDSKANQLSKQEKHSLLEEHERERQSFSAVATYVKTALQQARNFLSQGQANLLHRNMTTSNRTLLSKPDESVKALRALLKGYKDSTAALHQEVLNSEAAQHKSIAKLLTLHSEVRPLRHVESAIGSVSPISVKDVEGQLNWKEFVGAR